METLTKEEKDQLRKQKYREYYHSHKEEIAQYRKQSGLSQRAYNKYYESKKEEIRAKNLARYYAKKATMPEPINLGGGGDYPPEIPQIEIPAPESENVPA